MKIKDEFTVKSSFKEQIWKFWKVVTLYCCRLNGISKPFSCSSRSLSKQKLFVIPYSRTDCIQTVARLNQFVVWYLYLGWGDVTPHYVGKFCAAIVVALVYIFSVQEHEVDYRYRWGSTHKSAVSRISVFCFMCSTTDVMLIFEWRGSKYFTPRLTLQNPMRR